MASDNGREKDRKLLGLRNGQGANRLLRAMLFRLAQERCLTVCYRCGQEILTVDEFSLDHKVAWRSAPDPEAAFFDLDNVAFSHLHCNCGSKKREQTHCVHGHEFTPENTYIRPTGNRSCRECNRRHAREYQHKTRVRRARGRE